MRPARIRRHIPWTLRAHFCPRSRGNSDFRSVFFGTYGLSDLRVALWLAVVSAIPAGLIVAAVLFPIRRYARRLGLLDRPGGHKSHVTPTPLGGGIGIWLGVVLTMLCGTLAVAASRQFPELQDWLPAKIAMHLE